MTVGMAGATVEIERMTVGAAYWDNKRNRHGENRLNPAILLW